MQFEEAFTRVLQEARRIEGISEIERTEYYEPLKTVVWDLLRSGTEPGKVIDEAVSWLRQQVQVQQSADRVNEG